MFKASYLCQFFELANFLATNVKYGSDSTRNHNINILNFVKKKCSNYLVRVVL